MIKVNKKKNKTTYIHMKSEPVRKQKLQKIAEMESNDEIRVTLTSILEDGADHQIKKRYKREWEEDDA